MGHSRPLFRLFSFFFKQLYRIKLKTQWDSNSDCRRRAFGHANVHLLVYPRTGNNFVISFQIYDKIIARDKLLDVRQVIMNINRSGYNV